MNQTQSITNPASFDQAEGVSRGDSMTVFLLTVTMPSDSDGDYHHHWVCATREECFRQLTEWVNREEDGFRDENKGECSACGAINASGKNVCQLTDNPINRADHTLTETEDFHCWICIGKVTDQVEAYFATSEDTYEITECPVFGTEHIANV